MKKTRVYSTRRPGRGSEHGEKTGGGRPELAEQLMKGGNLYEANQEQGRSRRFKQGHGLVGLS